MTGNIENSKEYKKIEKAGKPTEVEVENGRALVKRVLTTKRGRKDLFSIKEVRGGLLTDKEVEANIAYLRNKYPAVQHTYDAHTERNPDFHDLLYKKFNEKQAELNAATTDEERARLEQEIEKIKSDSRLISDEVGTLRENLRNRRIRESEKDAKQTKKIKKDLEGYTDRKKSSVAFWENEKLELLDREKKLANEVQTIINKGTISLEDQKRLDEIEAENTEIEADLKEAEKYIGDFGLAKIAQKGAENLKKNKEMQK